MVCIYMNMNRNSFTNRIIVIFNDHEKYTLKMDNGRPDVVDDNESIEDLRSIAVVCADSSIFSACSCWTLTFSATETSVGSGCSSSSALPFSLSPPLSACVNKEETHDGGGAGELIETLRGLKIQANQLQTTSSSSKNQTKELKHQHPFRF